MLYRLGNGLTSKIVILINILKHLRVRRGGGGAQGEVEVKVEVETFYVPMCLCGKFFFTT